MGTIVRSGLSEKNRYWIERHRYYELKHFCMQYPIWKSAYVALDGLSRKPSDLSAFSGAGECGDPTAKCAVAKAFYSKRMEMLEQVAADADQDLAKYILKGVTEGVSYNCLKSRLGIPCSKDTYYDRYRRFFWLLNKVRE
ncbi:hypothetical protein AALC25_00315 [Lachnospiraceae bacterium 29-84]